MKGQTNIEQINRNSHNKLEVLRKRNLSLRVLVGNESLFESRKSGMLPLLEAIGRFGRLKLRGTITVDKIVGKAAALLLAYFKPKEVYCVIISHRAEEILCQYGIVYYSEKVVPEICRPGSVDLCPFEKAVLEVETPLQGYRRLVLKLFSFGSYVG
ncbi:DUF1893 domain-containing protein [Candidatus Bathyarchaeota archaeon]|nr:DUF1893 domain-containing protein [Candidatus Bathyarchaeota archaeon]